jgi:hypothetical protein
MHAAVLHALGKPSRFEGNSRPDSGRRRDAIYHGLSNASTSSTSSTVSTPLRFDRFNC